MIEWPKSFYVPAVGKVVKLEDFERLLEFAISAIQAAGQTDRDREAIRHDIIETIQDRIWREKNGNVAD
jgi:hypothetical protein